jgi:prephenate dehydrogenase
MSTVNVGILGLGQIGASVALALNRYNQQKDARHTFVVTAADLRGAVREEAVKIGLSKPERDLFAAARGQDVVVLALPYADVPAAYEQLGREMRSGAVLLDASPLKRPSLEWARQHLAAEAHQVGIMPVLNPAYLFDGLDDTLHAKADLFDKGTMLLMPAPDCAKEAVELAADFSTLLGAAPHFFDPVEHDSLAAQHEGLPALLGVALFYASSRGSGWGDGQRLTNASFGRITHHLHDTHPDDLRDALLNNREALLRQLDAFMGTLKSFRDVIERSDRAALEAALIESADAYSAWINRRATGQWIDDDSGAEKAPTLGNMVMSGFMGSFLSRRLQGGKKGDEE